MHATHPAAVTRNVLEDYPPVDKPSRLPLRQRWRCAAPLAQAPDLAPLCRPRRFLVLVEPGGGEIRAACERSLGQAREALGSALPAGAPIAFDAVRAHRFVDAHSGREMEPLMFVRIDAPRPQWHRLSNALRARGARLHEVEMQAHRVVLRAQAPLERLLGFDAEAHAASDGAAHVRMSLVRYV